MNSRPLPLVDPAYYVVDDLSPVEDGSTRYERVGAVWDAYDSELEIDRLRDEVAQRGVTFTGRFKGGLWSVAAERDGVVGLGAGTSLEAALEQLIEAIDEHDARVPLPPRVPIEAQDYVPTAAPGGHA